LKNLDCQTIAKPAITGLTWDLLYSTGSMPRKGGGPKRPERYQIVT